MTVSTRHVLKQGPVLGALGRVALLSLRQRLLAPVRTRAAGDVTLPGPLFERTVVPPPRDLIDDYLKAVGGDPAAYANEIPPHLFPQWAFPLAARTLEGLPYPLLSVVNGGCALTNLHPLPAGEPLLVRAQLEHIDDDGRRAVLKQRVITGTKSQPDALITDFYAIVPLGRRGKDKDRDQEKSGGRSEREKPTVPSTATKLATWDLGEGAGLDFAKLTGDFNPIHWIAPYAKASGFANVILHGFGTMARAYEGLVRHAFGGRVHALRSLDVRFTKPLVLPASVGLFRDANGVYVGHAPGSLAYLTGTFAGAD